MHDDVARRRKTGGRRLARTTDDYFDVGTISFARRSA